MEHIGYRVVFVGIRPGVETNRVAQELALAFRTTPEKMKALLAKLPLVLKENVDHATALKYQKVVTDAGGVSRVEAVAAGGAAAKSGQAPPLLKVCPKCGYKAVSSNDPLVNAFQGRGECPACGIILARFEQNVTRKDSGGRPVSEKASPRPPAGATAAKPALPIKLRVLSIGLVLIAAAVYFFPSGDKTSDSETRAPQESVSDAGRTAPVAARRMVAHKDDSGASIRILPGESKMVKISTYLRLFHEDSETPLELDPNWQITQNSWEKRGIEVQLVDATITNHSALLWERSAKDSNWWPARSAWDTRIDQGWPGLMAIFPRGNIQPRIHQGGPDPIATFPDDDIQPLRLFTLFSCGNVRSLKNMSEMTREQVEAIIENVEMGSPDLRQNGFILYKANLEFSIRVPGGAEFESRNLTRLDENGREISVTAYVGRILLKLSGAQITNMPLILLMDMEEYVHLDIRHVTGEEGILLKFAPASIMLHWEMSE